MESVVTGGVMNHTNKRLMSEQAFNAYHAMGRFSGRQISDIFFFKFFLENRISHFMQIGSIDNLHEVSNPIF